MKELSGPASGDEIAHNYKGLDGPANSIAAHNTTERMNVGRIVLLVKFQIGENAAKSAAGSKRSEAKP